MDSGWGSGSGSDGDAGVVADPAEVAGDARENVRVAHLAAGRRAVRHDAHKCPQFVLFRRDQRRSAVTLKLQAI